MTERLTAERFLEIRASHAYCTIKSCSTCQLCAECDGLAAENAALWKLADAIQSAVAETRTAYGYGLMAKAWGEFQEKNQLAIYKHYTAQENRRGAD